jgi:hypothetical protein
MNVSVNERMTGFRVPQGVAGDRDQDRVAQLERARGRDGLARAKTAEDQDLVFHHGPAPHRLEVGSGLARRVGFYHEDMISFGSLAERAHRDRHRPGQRPHRNFDPHGRAGSRRGLGDPGPHQRVPRGRIHPGIDGHDPGRERSRLAGGEHRHVLSDPEARRDYLRDREIHIGRSVHALERRQLGSLVQVLADMHVGQPHPGPKRRPNRLPGDDGPEAGRLGQRDISPGPCLVHLFLRRGPGRLQSLQPLECRPGKVRLRLQRLQLGFFHRDIEGHQDGAGFDNLARRQADPAHRAGDFILERDGIEGENSSDRRRGGTILPLPGQGGDDRFDRLGLVCGSLLGAAKRGDLPQGQASAGHQHGRQQQGGSRKPARVQKFWATHFRMDLLRGTKYERRLR